MISLLFGAISMVMPQATSATSIRRFDAHALPSPLGQVTGVALTANQSGYWAVTTSGTVYTAGNAVQSTLSGPMQYTPDAIVSAPGGFWINTVGAEVIAGGSASNYGSEAGVALNAPVVSLAATSDGRGYWQVAADGGIFGFGEAASKFYGSIAGIPLVKPVVAMATTNSGNGYWLVAADGGVFNGNSTTNFGDATFWGSTGNYSLVAPIVGITAAPSSLAQVNIPSGYWLVASDGGIFAFGDAPFLGSAAGYLTTPNSVVGMAATSDGRGYWLFGSDGTIYPFGDAVNSSLNTLPQTFPQIRTHLVNMRRPARP